MDYTVPTAHWGTVDWHIHALGWTARDHPQGQSLVAYLTARGPGEMFSREQVDEAVEWLAEQFAEQPFPANEAAFWGGDPVGRRLAFTRERLAQPADVAFGYTSSHNNFAARLLVLCPRPGVPCRAGRGR